MQRLSGRWPGRLTLRTADRSASAVRRRELRLGLVGALFAVLVLVAAAVVYIVPIGQQSFTADLSEAQSVQVGDDVRIAGVPVGKVKSLRLYPDRVVMRFTVKSGVFIGDQSTLDVRMLTVVGGHYVALLPAGSAPLGDKVIPADRVRLPYSLMQVFQDAEQPIREIDGNALRRNLGDLATSLAQAPDSLRNLLGGIEQFVDTINRQRADVSKAIALTDEYTNAIDTARGSLHRLVDKVNLLETLLVNHRAELRTAVDTLDRVVGRLGGLKPAWDSTLRPMATQLAAAATQLMTLGHNLEPVIGQVQQLGAKLRQMVLPDGQVHIDQSGRTIVAPGVDPAAALAPAAPVTPAAPVAICVPVPGKAC